MPKAPSNPRQQQQQQPRLNISPLSAGMKRPANANATPGSSTENLNSRSSSLSSITSGAGGPTIPKISRSRDGFRQLKERLQAKSAGKNGLPYELTEQSLILFNPAPSEEPDAYHPINKKDGIIPVIVDPHFVYLHQDRKLTGDQVDGLKFLWNSVVRRKQGCILGHRGAQLGNNAVVTSIVFLFTLFEQSEGSRGKPTPTIKKALVITPKCSLPIWKSLITEWSPPLKKLQYVAVPVATEEPAATRAQQLITEFEINSQQQVLLLTYDTYKKYKNEIRAYKEQIDVAICDESHYLKNEWAQQAVGLGFYDSGDGRGARSAVKILVGLTGTPYQHRDDEICNLVNLFRPTNTLPPNLKELLGKLKVADSVKNDVTKRPAQREGAAAHALKIRRGLYTEIRPVIHFRSAEIGQGVDKHELVVCVKLREGAQEQMYQELTNMKEFQDLDDFTRINLLRKLCVHPEYAYKHIISGEGDGRLVAMGAAAERFEDRIAAIQDEECPNYAESGKLDFVINLISHILFGGKEEEEGQDKLVVVSHFTQHLQWIEEAYKLLGKDCLVFTGGETSEANRKKIMDKWTNSTNGHDQILLLSSEAAAVGGRGLDLTCANHLILMDPGWTPAVDNQIASQIYAKGHTKRCCFVYRILCTNTIEEVMFLNQIDKQELEDHDLPQTGRGDLTIYHNAASGSFIKDRIGDAHPYGYNGGGAGAGEESQIERAYFAAELSTNKQYSTADQVPAELNSLKASWQHGVSFVFDKFLGDDGSDVYWTRQEIFKDT